MAKVSSMKLEHLLSACDEEIPSNKEECSLSNSKSHTTPMEFSSFASASSSSTFRSDREDPHATTPQGRTVRGCKTPGCMVCVKGPPPSFEKGTPIWAQILHLVLFSLTESAKMTAATSPKAKIKKYFHLRDDIYEYISQHWDVICRRERIKNWRHTIGMTLSHYQKLFQNGYHIFQNTGYWSLKDNVPSPYMIDTIVGDTSPHKRKYREKELFDVTSHNASGSDANEQPALKKIALDRSMSPQSSPCSTSNALPILSVFSSGFGDNIYSNSDRQSTTSEEAQAQTQSRRPAALRFTAMKAEIERFKKEMIELQQEIDGLQEQVKVKNAEEQLLKFLQEGITAFRDRIKQRIELLRAEMLNNHAEHQQQINNMSTELVQLREMGSDLRSSFQEQFSRLVVEKDRDTEEERKGDCIALPV